MQLHSKYISVCFIGFLSAGLLISCKKLVTIEVPNDRLTTAQIFKTDAQAETAMAGIYSNMINGNGLEPAEAARNVWSAGLSTILGGLSADEFYTIGTDPFFDVYGINKVKIFSSQLSDQYWNTAYLSIYGANAVIEGIAASTSQTLLPDTRKKMTGEAKFIRALAYLYLTNFFGDVPLVLTVDFQKTVSMEKTPQNQVYQQIIEDLEEAQANLPVEYSTDAGLGTEIRVRPNKWAASALLARVYLYQGNMEGAVAAATAVIEQQALYVLEPDLNQTFTNTSREAIWQLMQTVQDAGLGNATPEGYSLLAVPFYTGGSRFKLSDQLMNAFEPADKRRQDWIDSTDNTENSQPAVLSFYPTKYKIGFSNRSVGSPATEFYMVLRLAELYLIRAEANARGGPGGLAAAIDDLNTIRRRAGLADLANTLTNDQVLAATELERQVELFAEWGHRWFDLKRTGRASQVLSTVPLKQPWDGDYQLLYPIPVTEISNNSKLLQNPGYF